MHRIERFADARILIAVAIATATALAAAAPGDDSWDDRFFIKGPSATANCVTADTEGNVYVGGSFLCAGGKPSGRIGRWMGATPSGLLFGDGFETGDTGAWGGVTP